MPRQETKKSGGLRKVGRNREKCKRYRERRIRERNKLKRVLRSNGVEAAVAYARANRLPIPPIQDKERKNVRPKG